VIHHAIESESYSVHLEVFQTFYNATMRWVLADPEGLLHISVLMGMTAHANQRVFYTELYSWPEGWLFLHLTSHYAMRSVGQKNFLLKFSSI